MQAEYLRRLPTADRQDAPESAQRFLHPRFPEEERGCRPKIIAVPLGDPNYNYMFDISQLPEHLLDEIRHFFTVYKELEGRTTVVSKAQNREVANRVIVECINNYNEKFNKKDKENKDKNKKG